MLFHNFQPGQDIIVKGNLGIAFMCGFNVENRRQVTDCQLAYGFYIVLRLGYRIFGRPEEWYAPRPYPASPAAFQFFLNFLSFSELPSLAFRIT